MEPLHYNFIVRLLRRIRRYSSIMLRILMLTDASENAHAAMRTALQLARSYSAEVVFLHTLEHPPVPATSPQEVYTSIYENQHRQLEQKIQQQCQQLYQELDLKPKEVLKDVQILPPPLAEAILQFSHSKDISLVVMGTSGNSELEKFFVGSNTSEMIRLTVAPLLIVPLGYRFQAFKVISVVIRLKHFGRRPGLYLLEKIAHTYNAQLHFVFVLNEDETQPGTLPLPDTYELLKNQNHEITSIRKATKRKDLQMHLQRTGTDLLVWLPMQHGLWGNAPSEQFTEEAASKLGIPLLVIPHLKEPL